MEIIQKALGSKQKIGKIASVKGCALCNSTGLAGARFSLIHGGLICNKCLASDKDARAILPGTIKFIEHIRNSPFEMVARIKVASQVGEELESILRKFLDYHIERRLKTLEFLKEIEK